MTICNYFQFLIKKTGMMRVAYMHQGRSLCFSSSLARWHAQKSLFISANNRLCPVNRTKSRVSTFYRNYVSMNISQDVSTRLKSAMKNKDTITVKALRGIRASFISALKEKGNEDLNDEQAIKCLRKLEKMRKESIEMFEKGGRQDLVEEEKQELLIIQEYLPKLASENQIRTWVEETVQEVGASKLSDMGKVIGAVMKKYKTQVDGNVVRKIATEVLS